jgi:hypothetical protein
LLQKGHWPAGGIAHADALGINPQAPVNRCQEVSNADAPGHRMLSAPVGGADDLALRNATAAE